MNKFIEDTDPTVLMVGISIILIIVYWNLKFV